MMPFINTKASVVFTNRISTDEEKQDEVFQQQNDNIKACKKSLKHKTNK
jgi:hypothetical protein